jgi:hypothetical protein
LGLPADSRLFNSTPDDTEAEWPLRLESSVAMASSRPLVACDACCCWGLVDDDIETDVEQKNAKQGLAVLAAGLVRVV